MVPCAGFAARGQGAGLGRNKPRLSLPRHIVAVAPCGHVQSLERGSEMERGEREEEERERCGVRHDSEQAAILALQRALLSPPFLPLTNFVVEIFVVTDSQ